MAAIAGWWALPAVALVVIVVWTMWRGRTRRPLGMYDTVTHYEQFQAVLTRVVAADPVTGEDADRPGAPGRTSEDTAEPRRAAGRDVP